MRIGIMGGACHWTHWGKPYQEIRQETPYGDMADVICAGKYNQHDVFTLQRHGGNYQLLLEEIPWKANAYGMYLQKLDFIIHLTACGSLRETDQTGDLVLFDQLIDFTKRRPTSLGFPALQKVTYLDFSKPISEDLINFSHQVFVQHNITHHVGGTMLSEEGPKYSSMAESKMFIRWGADFLNHTSCPEIYFCRELSIPVLAIAMVSNKIQTTWAILSEEISSNIVKFKNLMPSALGLLLEYLPDQFEAKRLDVTPYNVGNFELRDKNKLG